MFPRHSQQSPLSRLTGRIGSHAYSFSNRGLWPIMGLLGVHHHHLCKVTVVHRDADSLGTVGKEDPRTDFG